MPEELLIRVSALPGYADCPRRGFARMFRKNLEKQGYEFAPGRRSIATAIGDGVHAMMADLFKQKISYGTMSVAQAQAAREAKFLESINDGEIIYDETTRSVDQAKRQMMAICEAFMPIAQMTDMVAVEDELEAVVSPLGDFAIPVRLRGHRDGKDARNEIHDHKTGKEISAYHSQMGGYALLSQLRDEEVAGVRVNFAPRLPVSRLHETAARSFRYPLDECVTAAWQTIRTIQQEFEHYLESGEEWAFPANPQSQSCTEKYCLAYGTKWCKVGYCG